MQICKGIKSDVVMKKQQGKPIKTISNILMLIKYLIFIYLNVYKLTFTSININWVVGRQLGYYTYSNLSKCFQLWLVGDTPFVLSQDAICLGLSLGRTHLTPHGA